jgi:transposase
MSSYSLDLRQRIVDAYRKGDGSVRELAQRFVVAPNTVENYLRLERETGSVAPRPHRGGPAPKLDEAGVQQVRTLLEEKNDQTLAELTEQLADRHQVRVSPSTVWRAVQGLGITRKKRRSAPASKTGLTCNSSGRAFSSRCRRRARAV